MAIRLMTFRRGSKIPNIVGNTVFHSNELFHVFEQTPGYCPIMIVAFENKKPLARLLGVIRKSVRLFPPSIIKRCEFYGDGDYFDPKADKKKLFGMMLGHITNIVKQQSFLIEFRNLDNPLMGYEAFRKNGYFPMHWLRVYNSLHSRSPIQRLSASRRRQINRAMKAGVTVDIAKDENEILEFSLILKRIYSSKVRKHFPDINFFRLLAKQNPEKEMSKIFIVKHSNKIIGGSLSIFSKETAYLWYWGGMKKTYPLFYPSIMAVWGAIDYSYKKGYQHIEFMDGGVPYKAYGYKDFILRFGGKQTSTRRWFRLRWNWLNKLLCQLYT